MSLEDGGGAGLIVGAADDKAPEILLVDPSVEDGDGLELLPYARAKVPWAQALLISTSDNAHLMGSYIAAGANDVVTRPFDIGTLESRIVRLSHGGRIRGFGPTNLDEDGAHAGI